MSHYLLILFLWYDKLHASCFESRDAWYKVGTQAAKIKFQTWLFVGSASYRCIIWIQISGIGRGHRQIMHQLDNLSNLLRESLGNRSRQVRTNQKSVMAGVEPFVVPIMFSLTIGGLGVFLMKGFFTRNWFLHLVQFLKFLEIFNPFFFFFLTLFDPSARRRQSIDLSMTDGV